MKDRWVLLSLVTIILSSALFADTCAQVVGATPRVNRSFKLTVLDASKTPRVGVKVALGTMDRYNAMHPISSGVTDKNGVLNFVNVKTGTFTFQLSDPLGERQWYDVEVVAEGGEPSVDYNWPYVKWIALRSASGILMNGSEPMRHWAVTLQGFPDGNELAFSDTDNQGKFDLPANEPGRYYIEMSQSDSSTGTKHSIGRIPITVTMDERYAAVDPIFVGLTSCGITYDQFCALPATKLESTCLDAVKADGTPVAGAYARLYSQRGSVAATNATADEKGEIRLPNLAAGDYQLQIFAPGYTPVRRPVTIAPGRSTCETPMVVPMNVLGGGCAATSAPGKGNE